MDAAQGGSRDSGGLDLNLNSNECSHHWMLVTPDGRSLVEGRCISCGVEKLFPVAHQSTFNNSGHRLGLRLRSGGGAIVEPRGDDEGH